MQRKDDRIQNLTGTNGKLLDEREKREHFETRFREEQRRAAAAEKRVAELQARVTEKYGVISGLQTVYWGDRVERRKKPRIDSSMKPDTSAPGWKKQPRLNILAEDGGRVKKETEAVPPDQQVHGERVGCEEAVPPPGPREAVSATGPSSTNRTDEEAEGKEHETAQKDLSEATEQEDLPGLEADQVSEDLDTASRQCRVL